MTDNEIVKALECCSNADRITECGRCPYYRKGCLDKVHADATDLINRQKAESEELKQLLQSRHRVIEFLEGRIISLPDEIRAEAVKEFAERLKTKVDGWYYDFKDFDDTMDALMEIDNLVKEFTGGEADD